MFSKLWVFCWSVEEPSRIFKDLIPRLKTKANRLKQENNQFIKEHLRGKNIVRKYMNPIKFPRTFSSGIAIL